MIIDSTKAPMTQNHCYTQPFIELFNEDCLQTLSRFEDNSIDCVITDPPYSGLTSKSKGTGRFANDDNHIEFDDMSERAFLLFVKPIFRELYRTMKLGSHLYCFTDWKQLRNMADCLELASFKIVNIVCWDKGHFGMGAGYRSQSEYLLVFSKGLPNTFNLKNIGNVIKVSRAKETTHPHQKPTELLKILVENSTKEQVNKVSAKKAKAQAKANNILYKDILANLNKSTEGLLKTSFGVKKSDIYKEEIFSELSDKEKKVARKKFRNTILSLSESLIQEKDKTRLEKLKKAFLDFYKQVYKVNDFSLSSVCSENMKETNKEILKKALQIVKK